MAERTTPPCSWCFDTGRMLNGAPCCRCAAGFRESRLMHERIMAAMQRGTGSA